ncbi:hypothetical protein BC827DRAFT_726596 [Russula dissimulans]|nr:hypothetical protein BC827DRAFT_726596 [Russula dissimulans]
MSSNATATPKSAQKGSFFDLLKPRHHEAVFRLKNSIIVLISLFTLTHLLPLPTPYASAWKVYRDSFQSPWEKGLAIAELSLFCLLLINIFQSAIAIRSPPAPYPPIPSPSKPLSPAARSKEPPTWRSSKRGPGSGSSSSALSPNTTPQRQLAFSTSAGVGVGVGSSGGGGGGVGAGGGSSAGSLPPTPSPAQATSPLAAYRGRRAPTGRALDGSLLARLALAQGSDSDVDE